jgi:membrane anchored protein
MRKLVLLAICCSGLFYAPLPLTAQNGGGPTPLIPVADMPSDNGGATAPSDPPLEVDPGKVPELVPSQDMGGGAEAPSTTPAPAPAPTPAPTTPTPAPEPEPTASVAMPPRDAQPSQDQGEEPVGSVPEEVPNPPETDEQDQGNQNNQDEEQFEEEFDGIPEPGEPESPAVAPEATAGPQLPRTGADLPALLVSGLALLVSGMSLRALCRPRS